MMSTQNSIRICSAALENYTAERIVPKAAGRWQHDLSVEGRYGQTSVGRTNRMRYTLSSTLIPKRKGRLNKVQ
jgi:hypothetical protein